jgi:polyferredoxin/formate hydrogenlyase subunit 6/NADH:ubiquinone oxidoreductase subunit I
VRWVRRGVQIASLALFIALLFAAQRRVAPFPQAGVFFRFDPLTSFAAMLAARQWIAHLAPALITMVLALVFGRVWCGWICPLGTLLGWVRFPSARRLEKRLSPRLRSTKYVLLGAIAAMAAFGSLTLLVLDPIALSTRTATTSLLPGFDAAVTALEKALAGWGPGAELVFWLDTHLRGAVLPASQPHYDQAIALFVVFLAIVLLDLLADRFWCRYLCPLGALLGLVAKVQVLRPMVGEGCTTCGVCARSCRMAAIENVAPTAQASAGAAPATSAAEQCEGAAADHARVVSSECTMCLDCFVACPRHEAMRLGSALKAGPRARYDPGRREFVTAAALGVGAAVGAGAALLLGSGATPASASPRLIRPPGAQDEAAFLARCLRCSECLLVCPTSGLQPALGQGGLGGLWTPVLVPRLGPCDYACTACGRVCPSGAIPKLDLETKRRQVLGAAVIDETRCLPWAQGTPCIVCEEMCPVPEKAIVLSEPRLITRPDGTQDYLARPTVIPHRCIGCGVCENKCPVEGTAAIVIRRTGQAGGRGRGRGEGRLNPT